MMESTMLGMPPLAPPAAALEGATPTAILASSPMQIWAGHRRPQARKCRTLSHAASRVLFSLCVGPATTSMRAEGYLRRPRASKRCTLPRQRCWTVQSTLRAHRALRYNVSHVRLAPSVQPFGWSKGRP